MQGGKKQNDTAFRHNAVLHIKTHTAAAAVPPPPTHPHLATLHWTGRAAPPPCSHHGGGPPGVAAVVARAAFPVGSFEIPGAWQHPPWMDQVEVC